jgi:DNA-binding beta-propeller fold protein YncE
MALPDSPTLVVTAGAASDTVPGSIYHLSTDLPNQESRLEPCIGNPRGFVTLRDIGRGYARCSNGDESVVDLDLIRHRIVRTVTLDRGEGTENATRCGPGGIALSRTGGILLATCSVSGQLLYLDRLTLGVLDSLAIGAGASQITVSPRGSQALVTIPGSNMVAITDLRKRSIVARIQLPHRPVDVVISGDGKTGYVLIAGNAARVVKIDLRRSSIQGSTAVPPGSSSLSVWPGNRSPSMRWR